LFAAARTQSNSALGKHAQKIEPAYRWPDIVLPDHVVAELHEVCHQVAHRGKVFDDWGFGQVFPHGKGVTALFCGSPGTGKSMAAEIIARELGVDLYRIDLSVVISKYIGETEKNLEEIFTAAPQANACLLFDEADALFGKRSAVHDAHDRYANQEVSYLLQRMERYDGLAILTTNRRDDLDEAFTRRLQFIVDFPIPSSDERLRIWRAHMPAGAPCDDTVDFGHLARHYPLAGGYIGNIALRAAHQAAAADAPISMTHLLDATRGEYLKMGRVAPQPAESLIYAVVPT
jgi:SpoVK/Ycf46/Vps4 family AAA+-type ATPase